MRSPIVCWAIAEECLGLVTCDRQVSGLALALSVQPPADPQAQLP